jgi:hypothetical protein
MSVLINATTSSGLIQTADNSGTLELQSGGTTQLTVSSTGAYGQLKSGTAVASTSGTSIDFTSIPSWVKRITVMFNGTSLNASGSIIVQVGAGSFTTSGYAGAYGFFQNAGASSATTTTAGFGAFYTQNAGDSQVGTMVIVTPSANSWVSSLSGANTGSGVLYGGNGTVTLGGTLDRVRITTAAGTATFDAGSINILYEG